MVFIFLLNFDREDIIFYLFVAVFFYFFISFTFSRSKKILQVQHEHTSKQQQPFLHILYGGIIIINNNKYYYWYYIYRYIEKVNETLMIEKILNKNHYHRLETEFKHVKYRIYTFCNV